MSTPGERLYWLHRPEKIDEETGEGEEDLTLGPLDERSFRKVFSGKHHQGFTGDSLYRREGMDDWHPLRAFGHFEFSDPDRLDKMRAVGIQYVQWLSMRHPDECAACQALEGKVFPIDDPPPMPPIDCTCELWCGCLFIVAQT